MGEREHLTGTPAQNCRGQRRPRWPLNNKSGDWHNLDQLLKPLLPLLSRSISAQTDSMLLLLLVFLLLLTGVSACLVRHLFGRKELLQPRSSKAGRERETATKWFVTSELKFSNSFCVLCQLVSTFSYQPAFNDSILIKLGRKTFFNWKPQHFSILQVL